MTTAPHTPDRCGIILAGGEGERLRPFIRQLRGSVLPKQYVNLIGTRSMLEHTFSRVEKLIPPGQIFTVVSQNHQLHRSFSRILRAIGSPGEQEAVKEAYAQIGPTNFSSGLMEAFPFERLLVLPVRGVFWSDWGSEQRIMNVLQKSGHLGQQHELPESGLFKIR